MRSRSRVYDVTYVIKGTSQPYRVQVAARKYKALPVQVAVTVFGDERLAKTIQVMWAAPLV